ncbi:hypothetical protein CMQ_3939 [Grosmannia clavigera kw1407]|uniref:Tat pathway signal sequence domain protein n=1 Tax=Grosmannia clavigera (strain kw1407 / UAMH 11150) TaxID=655863 RepID=F0X9L1_GROCL|nr:uncharacterized protein CMQ_3939 [Grosmannia clavigera kw1407]EFX05870.1 hypothetical protein CMQ_3939 [Grosmannia clavigera kw1407]
MQSDQKITVAARWLRGQPTAATGLDVGTTFGLPWPRGDCPSSAIFSCHDDAGASVPLQSWLTAFWPDGSIKWTAHAIVVSGSDAYHVVARPNRADQKNETSQTDRAIRVSEADTAIIVDTGKISVEFAKSGGHVVKSITAANGTVIGSDGHLVLLSSSDDVGQDGSFQTHEAVGTVDGDGTPWLPFLLRFYLYAGSEAVRIVHTIVYDGSPTTAIRGLGLRIHVPLAATQLHNRHVRLAGVGGGVLSEAIHGLTGLWRDPGVEVRKAQHEGRPVSMPDAVPPDFSALHRWVPAWNDYSLVQLSPDGFNARKRTKAGQSWVKISGGTRAGGLAFLGSAHTGGLAVGLANFWERYPTGIDVSDAAADATAAASSITLWLYSPAAPPMDLRPYHDGLGQAGFDDQLDALRITYEDWEPGLGSAHGIARTNEIILVGLDHTPAARETAQLVDLIRNPPLLVASSEHIYQTAALGRYWKPFSTLSTASNSTTLHRLDLLFQFYHDQIEQRRWYGFWDHGDIMHTYDGDRHGWRYDVGGYAWDNSELSPDLWLWLFFLCTGRADSIPLRRGPDPPHDCKQARVSNALYRRIFYYLTADERVGDLLDEVLDAESAFLVLDPYRKVRPDRGTYRPQPDTISISLGTDWSAIAAAWLIAWERRGPTANAFRNKLFRSMRGIARLPNGFVAGFALYNPCTGDISPDSARGPVNVSHLSAMFGLVELCAELAYLTDETDSVDQPVDPSEPSEPSEPAEQRSFYQAWLDYCRFYNAPADEQLDRYGSTFPNLQLRQGHSRLTAYAAARFASPDLAARARREFATGDGYDQTTPWTVRPVDACENFTPAYEAPWVSTNITALYGLAAIQNMAWLADE